MNSSNNKNVKVSGTGDAKHPQEKLKILAFHGYRQNGNIFKGKMGSFRKAVAKYAQLVFVTAPHFVKSTEDNDDVIIEDDQRGWWFNAEDRTFSGLRVGGPAIGFGETLKLVEQTVKEHGPFHGFLGFSQGACLVGILSAMQQKGLLPYSFKFTILIAGFCSGSFVHKGFYDDEIYIPSLHVFGESDKIIPKEMSETLLSNFVSPVVVEHSGGHYVPSSGKSKDKYLDYLTERLQEIIEEKETSHDNANLPLSS